ncbi:hypothetical protein PAXRUDRAFT_181817 [Paxillus rubicundulus Ve08.2h10]|uniref:Uncharacterized protein n=1 Tax=Paxillus rubicundulus Ve08.2h10 TaxID=930991 RepID=A0A0D0C837_9AGAM|nr:hypothetical protein PAXRUDRAFT_181817 [Paxillus rubicundulus Ve08.2h10]
MPTVQELTEDILVDTPGSIMGIELVDIFTMLAARPHHLFPNENLISHGYLGCSPVFPTVAVSIRTLSAFHQAHWTCPHFTIQVQCKTLCHLHHVPHCPYLCTQFSWVFDVYLKIIHRIEQRVHKALEHNTKDWQLQCTISTFHTMGTFHACFTLHRSLKNGDISMI